MYWQWFGILKMTCVLADTMQWSFYDIGKRHVYKMQKTESKISLTEKTEIFLDFFAERGGGVSPNPKGF